jgi:DNA-binding NarL/FixJ family response regulator
MPNTILIADDHVVVREGLRALLEAYGYQVVGEAADGREALALARRLRPDVAVLDVGMPSLNGVDTARNMRREAPDTRVVVLTVHAEDNVVVGALRAGVRAYVLKTQAAADLVRAIGDVLQGAIYLSPAVSSALVDAFLSDDATPADPLTPREREVLQLIAEGHSTRQVAATLHISVKTAETHRANIMAKLDVRDTAGLVRYAIRRGLARA